MLNLVLHFDFGYSYFNQISVKDQIFDRLPATITLGIGAMIIWLLVGIPVGIISALKRGRWQDRMAMGTALVAISAPVFFLGLVVLYLFSDNLGKLPFVSIFPGQGSYPVSGTIFSDPVGVISALILPCFVLAASFAAIYARFVRANLVETMSEDYIRTARAKGLQERVVVLRHMLRNSLIPFVTLLAGVLAALFGGALITETVFNWPGLGRLFIDALGRNDYNVVMALLFVNVILLLIGILITDILYTVVDPRIRLG